MSSGALRVAELQGWDLSLPAPWNSSSPLFLSPPSKQRPAPASRSRTLWSSTSSGRRWAEPLGTTGLVEAPSARLWTHHIGMKERQTAGAHFGHDATAAAATHQKKKKPRATGVCAPNTQARGARTHTRYARNCPTIISPPCRGGGARGGT